VCVLESVAGATVAGAALGILLKFAINSVAMPLLGAPEINASYH
jgi:hypothetical protein